MMSTHFNTSAASTSIGSTPAAAASTTLPHPDLKLPRMNLPVFSGNILDWPSFYDLFESAVHSNPSLQDSQRLYFLKTNLAGEAASLVSHLKIEDANYAPALAKLKERYNKPLNIAAQHIQRFLSQPAMTSPSESGLRSLHDVSDEVVRALKAMGREDRDIWLLYILVEKLDPETKQLWCQKRAELQDGEITLERFLKFVDAQSSALSAMKQSRQRPTTAAKFAPKPHPRPASTLVSLTEQASRVNCSYCSKSPHQLYQCGRYNHSVLLNAWISLGSKSYASIASSNIGMNHANPVIAESVVNLTTHCCMMLSFHTQCKCPRARAPPIRRRQRLRPAALRPASR